MIIDNDTIVAITLPILKHTNQIFIEHRYLIEVKQQQTNIINTLKDINYNLHLKVDLQRGQIVNVENQKFLLMEWNDELSNKIEHQNKTIKNKNREIWIWRGTTILILATAIIF